LADWGERDKHSAIPLLTAAPENVDEPMIEDPAGVPAFGNGNLAPAAGGARTTEAPKQVEYKMLRYFDFDLAPGRAYQYRIRLVLRDPNYAREEGTRSKTMVRVEIKDLDPKVVDRLNAKRKQLEDNGLDAEAIEQYMQVAYTDWSDPTPVVKVPPDIYVLALESQPAPPGRYIAEPAARVLVTKYDAVLGVETGAETALARGSVGNFQAPAVTIINPDTQQLTDMKDYPFQPESLLLDIRGGDETTAKGLPEPGELLILDLRRGGRLTAAGELEDLPAVQGFHARQQGLHNQGGSPQTTTKPSGGPAGASILD
jgi:hypothetical protein